MRVVRDVPTLLVERSRLMRRSFLRLSWSAVCPRTWWRTSLYLFRLSCLAFTPKRAARLQRPTPPQQAVRSGPLIWSIKHTSPCLLTVSLSTYYILAILWIVTIALALATVLLINSPVERSLFVGSVLFLGLLIPCWKYVAQQNKILLRGTWDIPSAATMKLDYSE